MTHKEQETSASSGKGGRRRDKPRTDQVSAYFAACPRCSFFLAGYRLVQQDFGEAVKKSNSGWLDLTWNLAVRNLVQKSFGCEMADDLQVFQGICPSCRRTFVYEAHQEEGEADQFSIKINPRF
ncbi:MAG TPA: hypothetical protein VLE70_21430 [Anaerolineae bacterium]|jgi:hypothetical protein|nr:hypothetical protein [Anaerolineae bacterium]